MRDTIRRVASETTFHSARFSVSRMPVTPNRVTHHQNWRRRQTLSMMKPPSMPPRGEVGDARLRAGNAEVELERRVYDHEQHAGIGIGGKISSRCGAGEHPVGQQQPEQARRTRRPWGRAPRAQRRHHELGDGGGEHGREVISDVARAPSTRSTSDPNMYRRACDQDVELVAVQEAVGNDLPRQGSGGKTRPRRGCSRASQAEPEDRPSPAKLLRDENRDVAITGSW